MFSIIEVMSRRRTKESQKTPCFLVSGWLWVWLQTVPWAAEGLPSFTPHWCDHELLVTKHISSHRGIPRNHFPPEFVDMSHLSEPTTSYCWHENFPSVILLVLPAQGTPTYPLPRFYHQYVAVSASSQASPSLLSIYPFNLFFYTFQSKLQTSAHFTP